MKGCAKTAHGWLCQVRIHGRRYTQRFPADTPREVLQRWLTAQQMAHRHDRYRRASGLLRDDVQTYLQAVAAMPTIKDRRRQMAYWVEALGARRRDSLTAADIAAQLQTWRGRWSASTCNQLRAALAHLWTVLDGRGARNPVRDVAKLALPRPAPRDLAWEDIARVLASMRPSASRARLQVLATTGLPPRQIGLLTAADVDLEGRLLRAPGRAKGAGAPGRTLPLSDAAVQAFQALAAQDAWGAFSSSSLRKAWVTACQRVLGRRDVSPYALRHAFAARVYAASGDLHAVGALLLHSSSSLTARYALAAVPDRLRKAVDSTQRSTQTAVSC